MSRGTDAGWEQPEPGLYRHLHALPRGAAPRGRGLGRSRPVEALPVSPIPIDLDVDDLRRAYEAGETCDEIAARYFVCRDTIRRRLIRAGVQLRRRWHYGYRYRPEKVA